MAKVGELDFDAFIERRKGQRGKSGPEGEHAYAYASDRQVRTGFEKVKPIELAVAASVRMFKSVGKGQLLGQAVKVSPRQFPRVHGLVGECARTLGIATPTAYIVNSPVLNAATYGTHDDAFILVHSALVDHFSEDELRSVIGHEVGHIHNNHVVYLTALHYLTQMAGIFLRWSITPATLGLRAWSRRAEVTCDRAALLCTKDLATAERSLAKLALGSQKLYEELDLEAFLEQHEEGKESIGRLSEVFATHPFLPKRMLALRVFAKSALYREHVGLGNDGLSMKEVDAQVSEIVQVVGR